MLASRRGSRSIAQAVYATPGIGKTPQARLIATGTPAAHAQRTGALRATATAVPATSAIATGSRRIGTAAATASSASGTMDLANSRQSVGSAPGRRT